MRTRILLACVAMLGANAAAADDAALLLGVERYETLGRVARGADVAAGENGLAALGFRVTALPNGRAAPTQQALADWLANVPDAQRLVVVLSGRFVTTGPQSWFLTAEAATPTLFALGDAALPIDSLLRVLSTRQGGALLVLAPETQGASIDDWLREGIGTLNVPQGVSVLLGEPRNVAGFVADDLGQPGGDLLALARARGLTWQGGYVPQGSYTFMPTEVVETAATPDDAPKSAEDAAAEDALWQGALALDTLDAYRNYLARYPTGRYTDTAEETIAAIVAEPNRAARLIEEGLAMTGPQRRTIQQSLQLLGYDPRGVDGIFGGGTRTAIGAWQIANGIPQTGYIDAAQLTRLEAQTARKQAEVEAEAARQAQAAAVADQDFWRETGAKGDAPGLRAYLDRYPSGAYASVATTRLAEIDAEATRAAEAREATAWAGAEAAGTAAAFQDYLQVYPEGRFAADARSRIAALNAPETPPAPEAPAAENSEAAAAEAALNLNGLTTRVVEDRLAELQFDPGTVDGVIDDATRAAIRRYQAARDLPVTGYLNQQVLVRLLADTLMPAAGQ
ncbi:peptidoglycan-binding domain 1 [Ketogulonicigenium robustum]|uniref:Peptidoglycan-binding domain 1 n=1 Tax=Ketogulonicigenium robustum TaxID=92947 RepID=A0A1W6P207_9RHOB|nr:peptidoglycan-binding domain-containing protein [Ketogulonicigenium robustum]ARO15370.1 peptidoglycan-binding domain 1 [Ketogulonicigenium robustum]